MVNPHVIKTRVEKANEYLDYLRSIKNNYAWAQFNSEPMIFGSAERFLHLAIEALLDLGNHIISDEELGVVGRYSDIARILFEHHYLDEAERNILLKIIGFRNILVHDYLELDLEIVFEVIQHNLGDLQNLLKKLAGGSV
jgi:uncharacterized protein YutE (UPF0331/DUF86 family)